MPIDLTIKASPITPDGELKFTDQEVAYLHSYLDRGDRGGYYMALYNLTGSIQCIEQAQISTFSEGSGGVAYAANFMLQKYLPAGYYPGIYLLSEKVAEYSLRAIEAKLDANAFNGNQNSGNISVQEMFDSAKEAWKTGWPPRDLERYFPGNLLAGTLGKIDSDFSLPPIEGEVGVIDALVTYAVELWEGNQLNSTTFLNRIVSGGFLAGFVALGGGTIVGKRLSDYQGNAERYAIATTSDGKYAVVTDRPTNKVVGVFNDEFVPTTFTEFLNRVALAAPAILAGLVGGAPVGFAVSALTEFLSTFLSDFHKQLSETPSVPGFNGDIAPLVSNPPFTGTTLFPITDSGTAGNDTRWGTGGLIPVLYGDTLRGGAGDDRMFGGDGGDELHGDEGADIVYGQSGDDRLYGEVGADVLRGGAGDDTLYGGGDDDQLDGDDVTPDAAGDDVLYGEAGNDTLAGGQGNDKLDGGASNDLLVGGEGADTLVGGAGDDRLVGGIGHDSLVGDDGNDTLAGGSGSWKSGDHAQPDNDTLIGGAGFDEYFFCCTFGNDTIVDSDGNGKILIEGMELRGGSAVSGSPNRFVDPTGYSHHTLFGTTLYIGRTGIQGMIAVKNWSQGQLGIFLHGGSPAKPNPTVASPLVLDFYGDGIKTLGLPSGVHFDMNNDGFAELTGWVGKEDVLLVRDLNGDGKITSGKELFGSETLLASGAKAANGFEALADLDQDGDGMITGAYAAYACMQVWLDSQGGGTHGVEDVRSPLGKPAPKPYPGARQISNVARAARGLSLHRANLRDHGANDSFLVPKAAT